MKIFAEQLEAARIDSKLSKNQLIEKSGISRMMVYSYLKGTSLPKEENIVKLAKACSVSPDYFDDYKLGRAVKVLEKNPALLNEVFSKANHHREFRANNVYYVN